MRRKNLPKSVTVMGQKFKLFWNHEFEDSEQWGETDVLNRTIRIGSKCDTAEKRASTLFHELSHAAIGVAGLEHTLGEKLEEAVVSGLENALFPLLNTVQEVRKIERKE